MIYDILQYGAVGDGTTNDGPAIQKAIDACAAAGGGRVLVPGGHIYKCGSILLHSHVELHLEHGSRLKASENKEDFLEVEAAYRDHYRDTSLKVPSYENCEYDGEPKNYFIMAKDAEDVCISGSGVIDGSEENFYGEIDHNFIEGTYYPRIPMLLMKGVQHLTIREVTLTRSAFWTVHMVGCQDVLIDGIRILNNLKMVNCDGIDPDHCRNVRINNCHIESADDCIVFKTTEKNAYLGPCENIVVSNCTLTSTSAAIKFGTESVSDFRNITVTNCVISRTNRGISLMLRDGGNIENVTFANLHINTRMFSDQWWGEAEAICVTVKYHVSGQLKVAPEHCSAVVLDKMGKPHIEAYKRFQKRFYEVTKGIGKEQYLVPYLMSSHPGSTLSEAIELALFLKENKIRPEQVQDFYPTPGTISTAMFYTELDPYTMEKVYVPKTPKEKAMQRRPRSADRYDDRRAADRAGFRTEHRIRVPPSARSAAREAERAGSEVQVRRKRKRIERGIEIKRTRPRK